MRVNPKSTHVTQLELTVSSKSQEVEALVGQKYRHGFITDIESGQPAARTR